MSKDDVQEIKEVLEAVGDKIPNLLKGVFAAISGGEEDPEEFGKKVAAFYKQMLESGMSEEKAFELTKKFMEGRDRSRIVTQVLGSHGLEHAKKHVKIHRETHAEGEEKDNQEDEE